MDFDFGPFQGESKTGLNQVLAALDQAKSDEKIEGIFLDLTSVNSGFATLREIRNKLMEFPEGICRLSHLKRLDLSRNALTGLPKCMGGLKELTSLDLWDNDLMDFPAQIAGMEALRFLDLRNIQFEIPEMERIDGLFPRAKVYFSQPCNCGAQP